MLINACTSLRRKVSNFIQINLFKSSSKYLVITYLLQLEKSDITITITITGRIICLDTAPVQKCKQASECHPKAKCFFGNCICQGSTTGNGKFCRGE